MNMTFNKKSFKDVLNLFENVDSIILKIYLLTIITVTFIKVPTHNFVIDIMHKTNP